MLSTEAYIIIHARKALAEDADSNICANGYIERVTFSFMDGAAAGDPNEWFSICRDRNIRDIKISVPETVDKHPFEGTDEVSDIVCIWPYDKATRFIRNQRWNNGKATIIYNETTYTSELKEIAEIEDPSAEYMSVLSDIMKFAEKIGYKGFNQFFGMAYELLSDKINADYEKVPEYLKGMPCRLMNIMSAIRYSYVFGGMGWWNDDPRGTAESMGLAGEYQKHTNKLIYSMRKALFYVTNTC